MIPEALFEECFPGLPAGVEKAAAPDRFGMESEVLPAPPEVGFFMVRGNWPVREPFGISPLWEH